MARQVSGPWFRQNDLKNGFGEVCLDVSLARPDTRKGSSLPVSGLKDVERH